MIDELEENEIDPRFLISFLRDAVEVLKPFGEIKEHLSISDSINYRAGLAKIDLLRLKLESSLRYRNDEII